MQIENLEEVDNMCQKSRPLWRFRGKKWRKSDTGLVLLTLPALLWYMLFCYLPMFGIVIAFKQYRPVPGRGFVYSLFAGSKWIGLENFRFLFLNPQLSLVLRNTLLYNIIFLIIDTALPVILAILISYLYSARLRVAAQTVSMLPHFLSWVIISYLLFAFLSTDKGLLNGLLIRLGADPVKWYQEPAVWPVILIVTHIWTTYGYAMVMYSAYLTAIDPVLYDSALMDGATVLKQIRYITIPLLRPVIVVLLLLNLGGILSTDFGLFYLATRNSGAILSTTQTIDVYIYKALMEQTNYGFSAAASLLQNGLGCLLLLAANFTVKRIDPEAGLL